MSELKEINHTLIQVKNTFSDNHTDLTPYIFWRYEYNTDSTVKRQPFIASQDHTTSWSNYRNNGRLNVYKIK
jgi:hypothetical protein